VSLEWLDGDEWTFQVQSIITSEELAAYGRLRTSQQRDAFIARFWASRDPSPDTPGNEFRDEYIRRVQAAIERFGASGQSGFGFDTDRGRVYLMLGAPDAIDGKGTGGARFETWRYASVAGIGEDVRVGFSIGRFYCGYRILSPAPTKAMEAATTERPGDEPVRHASVQIYPLGLTTVTIPVDAARVAGARYELHDGTGVQVDKGEIGSVDDAGNGGPLSRHLPPAWLDQGLGCTHALPSGRYTLSTAVRFVIGHLQRETVTFDVD
jgi:GWxTD domain-containing protein